MILATFLPMGRRRLELAGLSPPFLRLGHSVFLPIKYAFMSSNRLLNRADSRPEGWFFKPAPDTVPYGSVPHSWRNPVPVKIGRVRRLPRTGSRRSFNGQLSGSLLHTIAKALVAWAFGAPPTPQADVSSPRCYIRHQVPMRRSRPLVN